MMVHLRTQAVDGKSLGWSSGQSLTIDPGPGMGELREGFDADQLLCFAVGASYITTLLVEASHSGILVTNIGVDVSSEASPGTRAMPLRKRGIVIAVTVETNADEDDVLQLIERSDKVAAISNAVRLGSSVRLTQAHVTRSASPR